MRYDWQYLRRGPEALRCVLHLLVQPVLQQPRLLQAVHAVKQRSVKVEGCESFTPKTSRRNITYFLC